MVGAEVEPEIQERDSAIEPSLSRVIGERCGHGLSGVGSKAGGPDYLLQFVDPRVVTENTLRQGFAPGE